MNEWLESEEFYQLMQTYRWANHLCQKDVVDAYEAVKAAIMKKHKSEIFDDWCNKHGSFNGYRNCQKCAQESQSSRLTISDAEGL